MDRQHSRRGAYPVCSPGLSVHSGAAGAVTLVRKDREGAVGQGISTNLHVHGFTRTCAANRSVSSRLEISGGRVDKKDSDCERSTRLFEHALIVDIKISRGQSATIKIGATRA